MYVCVCVYVYFVHVYMHVTHMYNLCGIHPMLCVYVCVYVCVCALAAHAPENVHVCMSCVCMCILTGEAPRDEMDCTNTETLAPFPNVFGAIWRVVKGEPCSMYVYMYVCMYV
jgi:hypothetical protein